MSKSLSQRNETLVSSLTSYLRSLANRRSTGTVTADDAHNFLNRKGIRSGMTRTRQAVINAAFMGGDFENTGYTTPSSRPAAKGRSISEWTVA